MGCEMKVYDMIQSMIIYINYVIDDKGNNSDLVKLRLACIIKRHCFSQFHLFATEFRYVNYFDNVIFIIYPYFFVKRKIISALHQNYEKLLSLSLQ